MRLKSWPGLMIVALLAMLGSGLLLWCEHQLDKRQTMFVTRYWDVLLTDSIRLHGSWEEVTGSLSQSLASLEQAVGGELGLMLWDDKGQLRFQHWPKGLGDKPDWTEEAIGESGRRLILHDGNPAGYYTAAYRADRWLPSWIWAVWLIGVVAGSMAWVLMVRRVRASGNLPWKAVAARLRRMLGSERLGDGQTLEPSGLQREMQPKVASRNRQRERFELERSRNQRSAGKGRWFRERLSRQSVQPAGSPSASELPPDMDALLKQLEDRIYRLERIRKTMVADIAYELRNPLAVARVKLEHALARQASLSPEELVVLHDQIYRMSKLVRDLNLLVLAESGRLPLERSWVDLRLLISQLVETMAPEAEEAGVALELSGFDTSCSVYADRERLQQVFVNLLGNALRYARSRVEVSCLQLEASVLVTVRDDGLGIEEEELPYVFDRFYRKHAPGRRNGWVTRKREGSLDNRESRIREGDLDSRQKRMRAGGLDSRETRKREGSLDSHENRKREDGLDNQENLQGPDHRDFSKQENGQDPIVRDHPSGGGLGLGLAIVKEFVVAHGGQVRAESKWGQGTAFIVELPVFRE